MPVETRDPMSKNGRYRAANPLQRFVIRNGASVAAGRILAPTQRHVDALIFRISKGRRTLTSMALGWPIVLLTTVGARSGLSRTVPLLGLPDGNRIVVIASNYGRAGNPSWYHNLRAHPRVSMAVAGGPSQQVLAREAEGSERERLWQLALQYYPGWADYEQRVTGRRIPVIVLDPEAD
ncbi:nitroreductase family deazaflavin-dependent oxidoreductase [Rhodococcus xishaensis]|uniref:Nitroreductase family deazaflavin-dependent oxidoreductase n=2 Tax=Rhodococcus xishaensis TaxID=2487364 RepID=A0A438B3N9_9NOCA|nr:nitroreductase family deazaflavin-dependent oxidoreductase [Rhodococcus xishaensis]